MSTKQLITILFGLILVIRLGCSTQKALRTEVKVDTSKANHDWLLGSWIRTNDDPGQATFEYWKKLNDSTYEGLGCTLMGLDTVFKENITLVADERFEVSGVGDGGPVIFLMTERDDRSFSVENPENDFPKRIDYQKTKKGMEAIISGDGKERTFVFVPKNDF